MATVILRGYDAVGLQYERPMPVHGWDGEDALAVAVNDLRQRFPRVTLDSGHGERSVRPDNAIFDRVAATFAAEG